MADSLKKFKEGPYPSIVKELEKSKYTMPMYSEAVKPDFYFSLFRYGGQISMPDLESVSLHGLPRERIYHWKRRSKGYSFLPIDEWSGAESKWRVVEKVLIKKNSTSFWTKIC